MLGKFCFRIINVLDFFFLLLDQFSEEGEEASGVSPKKLLSSSKGCLSYFWLFYSTMCPLFFFIHCFTCITDELLNFGIKTLEEIRLGKALKASLNRSGRNISHLH